MKLFVLGVMSLLPIIIATAVIIHAVRQNRRRSLEYERLRKQRWEAYRFWAPRCIESLAAMDRAQQHFELTGDYEPFKQAEQQMNTNLRRYEKDVLGLP